MRISKLLLLVVFTCSIAYSAQQGLLDPVLEGLSLEEDDIPILPRGNLSDRECLQPNSTSKCSCINLWESDCRCDGTDSREKSVCGDCTWYCNEYFSPKNISEFEIDKCNVPKIKKLYAQLFIMSKSPYGAAFLLSWKGVMEALGDVVEFHLSFIVTKSSSEAMGFDSMHGIAEVEGDLYETCAVSEYPDYRVYMPFLYCLSLSYRSIPLNVQSCATTHGLDYNVLTNCVHNGKGSAMLEESARQVANYRITSSPTLIVDNRIYSPNGGRTSTEIISALCFLFDYPSRQFPWWVFSFMGAVVLALVLVVFIAKPWTRSAALDMLRTIIYVNYQQDRNNAAQPTIRDYAIPDADSDDEEKTIDVKEGDEVNVPIDGVKQKTKSTAIEVVEDDIEGDEEDPMLARKR